MEVFRRPEGTKRKTIGPLVGGVGVTHKTEAMKKQMGMSEWVWRRWKGWQQDGSDRMMLSGDEENTQTEMMWQLLCTESRKNQEVWQHTTIAPFLRRNFDHLTRILKKAPHISTKMTWGKKQKLLGWGKKKSLETTEEHFFPQKGNNKSLHTQIMALFRRENWTF